MAVVKLVRSWGLRGILLEQIETAQRLLLAQRGPSDTSIHIARKTLKRARATLRLLRPEIGDTRYHRANTALRDAAAPLREVRDAKVLLDTLDALRARLPRAARPAIAGLRRVLERECRTARRTLLQRPGRAAACSIALTRVANNARRWAAADDLGDTLAALAHTYKKGRSALAAAVRQPSDPCLHEWRKQTKYLWHELQLLRPLRPTRIGKLIRLSHRLADRLGDDHDLAVLRRKVRQNSKTLPAGTASQAMIECLDRRRSALQRKAVVDGKNLYADAPQRFARQFTVHGVHNALIRIQAQEVHVG
jgi:CHAD domain-containing protein